MAEDEMVGWHHQLNEREFEQALGDGDGQGSLVCYSPWGGKESSNWTWNNRLVPNRKRSMPRLYIVTLLI